MSKYSKVNSLWLVRHLGKGFAIALYGGNNGVNRVFYARSYHPIQARSIDGTNVAAHDNGVCRALLCYSTDDPFGDLKAAGDPYCTSHLTTEDTLREAMSKYGKVKSLCLIRHIVTGASRGYAFVEYETEGDASCLQELLDMYIFCFNSGVSLFARKECSFVDAHHSFIDGRETNAAIDTWMEDTKKMRRPIPHEDLKKLGIQLPLEGRYMSLRASVRCRRATTPDSERRPEALGRVYNTMTFVPVHRGMDRVGGEKLEVGTAQRIRIRHHRRELRTLEMGFPVYLILFTVKNGLGDEILLRGEDDCYTWWSFFALGNINPPAEANIQHPLNLLFNLLSMKECRFHVLWVFPFLCRCIVTWKQLMFGFMSGANITDITTQLKQTELGTSNLMECYLHNPVSFLEAVQPDLFKYKKWIGICVGHRLMDQALKRSYYMDFKLQRKRKNCRWNGSNLWVRFSPVFVAWTIDVDKFGMLLAKL
ncbi:hypothetical protein HID58_074483 [Brassica napus]|uniref:RRM domain-containing protein n=1 Tax=Brassica napus TaxID=3708 RepID=A0ABQ7YJY4_BRANA|nr:hypothetical protein HID58_074483 [Brassica napus]